MTEWFICSLDSVGGRNLLLKTFIFFLKTINLFRPMFSFRDRVYFLFQSSINIHLKCKIHAMFSDSQIFSLLLILYLKTNSFNFQLEATLTCSYIYILLCIYEATRPHSNETKLYTFPFYPWTATQQIRKKNNQNKDSNQEEEWQKLMLSIRYNVYYTLYNGRFLIGPTNVKFWCGLRASYLID